MASNVIQLYALQNGQRTKYYLSCKEQRLIHVPQLKTKKLKTAEMAAKNCD